MEPNSENLSLERIAEVEEGAVVSFFESHRDQYEDIQKARLRYFNNLPLKLIDFPDQMMDGRKIAMESGWEEPREVDLRRSAERYGRVPDLKGFSSKYLSTTYQKFYEDIDKVLLEKGLSREDVTRVFSKLGRMGPDDQEEESSEEREQRLVDMVWPIYLGLRVMGYNRRELIE